MFIEPVRSLLMLSRSPSPVELNDNIMDRVAMDPVAIDPDQMEPVPMEPVPMESVPMESAPTEPVLVEPASMEQGSMEQAEIDQARLDQARLDQARLDHARMQQATIQPTPEQQQQPTHEPTQEPPSAYLPDYVPSPMSPPYRKRTLVSCIAEENVTVNNKIVGTLSQSDTFADAEHEVTMSILRLQEQQQIEMAKQQQYKTAQEQIRACMPEYIPSSVPPRTCERTILSAIGPDNKTVTNQIVSTLENSDEHVAEEHEVAMSILRLQEYQNMEMLKQEQLITAQEALKLEILKRQLLKMKRK